MFSSENIYVSVGAVVFAMVFIIGLMYFTNKLFQNETQEILVRFILMVFSSLVGVWIIDKVVAFKINLLSPETNEDLFDLIKTLVLMIFSYYFGTKGKN